MKFSEQVEIADIVFNLDPKREVTLQQTIQQECVKGFSFLNIYRVDVTYEVIYLINHV